MNKRDIALSIENITTSKKEAQEIVDKIFETMAGALRNDEKVVITNFGSFNVFAAKLKKGRNPKTGESILIPPMKKVRFKVSKYFFNKDKKLRADKENA
ncbi:MAG: integration host factor subunit beta [Elusimicrobiota bacterium]|jgi:nucleoid DNA-binding protein|nr:integration host factor subunit beta [Elusimicrobiota bacterium]